MEFSEIISALSKTVNIEQKVCAPAPRLLDVALLDGTQRSFDSHTLYVGFPEQLSAGERPAQCILAGSGADMDYEGFCCCAILPPQELFAAFNQCRGLLEGVGRKQLYEELIRRSLQGDTIAEILDASAIQLGSSLVLVDQDYRVLAHSTSVPVPDKLWKEHIRRGYCSYDFIRAVRDMGLAERATISNVPMEVTCSESPFRKFSYRVAPGGDYAGFLLMVTKDTVGQSQHAITPTLLELFSVIGQAFTYILSTTSPQLLARRSDYQTLLYDLLIGAPPMELAARIEGLRFAPRMVAISVEPTHFLCKGYPKEHLAEKLKGALPGTHVTYHESRIAALVPIQENPDLQPEQWSDLCLFACGEQVRVGVSNPFSQVGQFSGFYAQARSALDLSRQLGHEQSVCRYRDYQFFDLLEHFSDRQKLDVFCHPALELLRRYDRENETELLRTLREYLRQGCGMRHTAQALFIHRNSLSYRLERIAELTQLDLSDPQIRFYLQISCCIEEYLGRYQ